MDKDAKAKRCGSRIFVNLMPLNRPRIHFSPTANRQKPLSSTANRQEQQIELVETLLLLETGE